MQQKSDPKKEESTDIRHKIYMNLENKLSESSLAQKGSYYTIL